MSNISPQPSDVEASSDVNGAFVDESFGFQVEAGKQRYVKFNLKFARGEIVMARKIACSPKVLKCITFFD